MNVFIISNIFNVRSYLLKINTSNTFDKLKMHSNRAAIIVIASHAISVECYCIECYSVECYCIECYSVEYYVN